MIVYFECTTGCGLRRSVSPEAARKAIRREYGTMLGPITVREATERDIEWVRNMGGYVPPGARKRKESI